MSIAVLGSDLKDRRIRVNAVSPGFTDTPGLNELLGSETGQQRKKMISNSVPLGRFGTPEEIAKAVVFLASDHSSTAATSRERNCSWMGGGRTGVDPGIAFKSARRL